MKFSALFEPIRIGKTEIKNRIALAPMGMSGLVDRNGGLTREGIDYYAERAFGGAGLIITGATTVTDIEPWYGLISVNSRSFPSLSDLAESAHYYGAKVFAQLTPGLGRCINGRVIDGGFKPFSASAIPCYWRPEVTARALATEEVEKIVIAMGRASRLLKAAGIDGIELHGHEGYLLDQFTTAVWNKRTDKYGGTLENRLIFPVEILDEIKNKAGADFPVIYRYGLKHYMKEPWVAALKHETYIEAGRDVAEGLQMAQLLEKTGFDALHVDAGCYDSWYWTHPPNYQPYGCLVDLAAEVKKRVTIPVIAVGRLDIPEMAEQVLRERKADMVALGRALLADPEWPRKVREGKPEEIRPCLACHDGCLKRGIDEVKNMSCAVNPSAARERIYTLENVAKPKKVLIAGGGIAGMEAARVAATRGCRVTLYEKEEKLGGHALAASVPEFKQDIRRLLEWYQTQLAKLGVEVKLQVKVTSSLIRKEKPDSIIIATGSKPIIPKVPGIAKPIVATCPELLLGRKKAGGSVVVVGGGLVGTETALWLAAQGKKVTIVEALPELARGMFKANRTMLLDLLRDKKVEFVTNAMLDEVVDTGVIVIDNDGNKKSIPGDTIALALGMEPCRELYQSLKDYSIEPYMIGDCKEPRRIIDAVWEGYHIARR